MSTEGSQRLAEVSQIDGGLQITVRGDWVRNVDVAMIESCVNSLAQCANANGCVDQRIAVSDACLKTLVGHHLEVSCIDKSFGLSAGRTAASA
jgi:hypothetical protein